ncbi:MAG: efflux RND transporter periplasmic adaptor subunit [Planctomycetaceae bacterium]
MKFFIRLLVILLIIALLGFGGYKAQGWLAERNKPRFKTAKVETGDLRISVNASGEVNPVLRVKVGSFVSGPILKLHVDYNTEVKAGDPLADIDPRIYDAAVARDEAALLTRKADVLRVQAELQRAINDEKRSLALKAENPEFISQAEMDQYRFSRQGLEAQLQVAEAGVRQAEANLENSKANVGYTKITSPVDGVVVDRKIDPGQTLAAQFQTPELFVIAPQMREKMHIQASVDEADIGLIKQAEATKQPVFFTVDAYPDVVFKDAVIEQIRIAPSVAQNVVTYPVIVATPNPDLKLLPGMTANLTFQVSELKDIVKIPNEALRFNPEKQHVRESDQKYLELAISQDPKDDQATSSLEPPVDDSVAASKAAMRRIVWVQETALEAAEMAGKKQEDEAKKAGKPVPAAAAAPVPATDPVTGLPLMSGKLRALEIYIGDSDYRFTQVTSGDLKDGDIVVTGIKPPEAP